MNKKSIIRAAIMSLASLAVVGSVNVVTPSVANAAPAAKAEAGTTTKFKPECASTTSDDMTTNTCVSGSATSHASDKGVSVARLRQHGRVVGEYLIEGGLTRQEIAGARCYVSHHGTNTIRESDGQISQYQDDRPQHICHTGNGPSGWQVVKCGNFYFPGTTPPKRYRVVRNPVVVESLDNFVLKAKMKVKSKSLADAAASSNSVCVSSSGSGSGYGHSSSSAYAVLTFSFRGKRQFKAEGERVRSEYELQLNLAAYAKARSKASAKAGAASACTNGNPPVVYNPPTAYGNPRACVAPGGTSGVADVFLGNQNNTSVPVRVQLGSQPAQNITIGANGTATVTFTGFPVGTVNGVAEFGAPINKTVTFSVNFIACDTPAQHYTNVSCQTPEEIFEGESLLVTCVVSNDNGAGISLVANSRDANSRISGVICTNNGTTVCPNGGTFQFRIEGLHEGFTSFQATASSNGVSTTFISDPFPVDPRGGGFKHGRMALDESSTFLLV